MTLLQLYLRDTIRVYNQSVTRLTPESLKNADWQHDNYHTNSIKATLLKEFVAELETIQSLLENKEL